MKPEANLGLILISLIVLVLYFFVGGVSLWKSAIQKQKYWFIVLFIFCLIPYPLLLIVNLIYLFKFSKEKLTFKEIKSWFSRKSK